jgi:hypothetical protein
MDVEPRHGGLKATFDLILYTQGAWLKHPLSAMDGPARQPPVAIVRARDPQPLAFALDRQVEGHRPPRYPEPRPDFR